MPINNGISNDLAPVQFSTNINTELARLSAEMRIYNILSMLASDQIITDEVKADIRHMMLVLGDLFSSDVPAIDDDPVDTLRSSAMEINLSRLLKERGLARMYRLINLQVQVYDELTHQNVLLPAFMRYANPGTGQQFKSREEFLGWFCKEALVPRSLVFLRMATYDKLLNLGMTIEEAFQVILKKPYASGEVLNEVGSWQRGELVDVNPDVAVRLARVVMPEEAGEIAFLAETIRTSQDPEELLQAKSELFEAIKPAMRQLVEEVADHPSMRDAMAMVRHDIGARPEIDYWFDPQHGWFVAELIRKARDPRGNSYVSDITKFNLVPEMPLPPEVVQDLAERLNVKNRGLDLR